MSYLLSEFRDIVDGQINAQDNELSQLRREREIKTAVGLYSTDKPDTRTEDVTGDAGRYYVLSTSLDYWTEGLSRVLRVQYPAPTIASDEAPVELLFKDWDDEYWSEGTRYLYLPNHAPAATESMRITYTLPWTWIISSTTVTVVQNAHGFAVNDWIVNDGGVWKEVASSRTATHQVSASADTNTFTAKILQVNVPDADFYAVCHLASALCCQALAARYSSIGDSYVRTDWHSGMTRAIEYSNRVKEFMALYRAHMGIPEDGVSPAGTSVSIGTPPHASLQHRWRRPIR